MNVSGILVQVKTENYDEVEKALNESDVCEVHFGEKDKGKIIITLEGKGVEEEMTKLRIVQGIPNVLAADMIHSYSEDELDKNMKSLANGDVVPAWLNDEDLPIQDIKYGGDVRNFAGK
jgi:nitrate reductase NapD